MSSVNGTLEWIDKCSKNSIFKVEKSLLSKLNEWNFDKKSITHRSGRFFSINGLLIETNYGDTFRWSQPIIKQPEIGILGFITKIQEGRRLFLVQAKIEPGNINKTQLSPTVQATKSNYTRVHSGRKTNFLEYFLDRDKSKVLVDRIQLEQGSRFYKKVNRNILVEIDDDIDFCCDQHRWIDSKEMSELLLHDNVFNMDSRSVLSCFLVADSHTFSLHDNNDILNWMSNLKSNYFLTRKIIPLSDMHNWKVSDKRIFNTLMNDFEVIGVNVMSNGREVDSWSQPILKEEELGLVGFITKKIHDVEHYLVKAIIEPGIAEMMLTATVQVSDYKNHKSDTENNKYMEYFINPNNTRDENSIIHDSIQSEEGGRFFHFQNRNMVVAVDDNFEIDGGDYIWMNYNQVLNFINYGLFNIEARILMACHKFR